MNRKFIEGAWLFFLFAIAFFLEPYMNKNISYIKFLFHKNDCCIVEANIQQVRVEKYYGGRYNIVTEEKNIALVNYEIEKQSFSNEIEVDEKEIQQGTVQIAVNMSGKVFRANVFNFGREMYAHWVVSLGYGLVGLILLSIHIILQHKKRREN
ncbi:MAG: hypothetical protein J6D02_04785 [Lachnospira sp.]|nr:hypothetical protein [Lachnospira sp.]